MNSARRLPGLASSGLGMDLLSNRLDEFTAVDCRSRLMQEGNEEDSYELQGRGGTNGAPGAATTLQEVMEAEVLRGGKKADVRTLRV